MSKYEKKSKCDFCGNRSFLCEGAPERDTDLPCTLLVLPRMRQVTESRAK